MKDMAAVYLSLMKMSILEQFQYRVANYFYMIGMVTEPVVYLVVWTTIARAQGGQVAGYTESQFAAYYIIWTLVRNMNVVFTPYGWEWRIREGHLSEMLVRPIHPLHFDLGYFAGWKFVVILMWLPIAAVLAWLFKPALSPSWLEVGIFFLAIWGAYLVRSMMMDVIRRGTGARAMELGRNDLAGKTGTSNEQRDAWFSGYNDRLVTTVWVGLDNHEPLGRREQGGRAALPVWMEFMAVALKGVEDRPPAMPDGLARARIDPDTGLLARLDDEGAIMEIFEAGKLPPVPETGQGESQDAAPEEDPYEIY